MNINVDDPAGHATDPSLNFSRAEAQALKEAIHTENIDEISSLLVSADVYLCTEHILKVIIVLRIQSLSQ